MAGTKTSTRKKTEYKSVAVTTNIRFTSRASVKVGDSFYTVECCEERALPDNANVVKERELLWDTVNSECDAQIEDILRTYKK